MRCYYCIDYMLDFDTHSPDDRCYLRREDAEKRAERIKLLSEEYDRHWAVVREMEVVAPYGRRAWERDLLDLVPDELAREVLNARYVGLESRFMDENDKLRELIRAMWFLLCVTGNDDLVAEVGKNGETMWTVDATAIAEKMRELGIEVDG